MPNYQNYSLCLQILNQDFSIYFGSLKFKSIKVSINYDNIIKNKVTLKLIILNLYLFVCIFLNIQYQEEYKIILKLRETNNIHFKRNITT